MIDPPRNARSASIQFERFMTSPLANSTRTLPLATESIVVKIRWFGIVMGYVLAQSRSGLFDPNMVRGILALGAGYAALDTLAYRQGRVFLGRWPLFVSLMEGTFLALLCYFDTGLDSPFRWYFLLSAICCAIRYTPPIASLTLLIHGLSLITLYLVLPPDRRGSDPASLPLTFVVLAWATWAASSLAGLLKKTGTRLQEANAALERHGAELEQRIAEQVEALRASQAKIIQQEKMAAFGLLSAGIAHEVGNPLAALSSLVQVLRRRQPDPYTQEKLALADSQLQRIQRTLRELIDFSRPASDSSGPFRLDSAVNEALGIAKYSHRLKDRHIDIKMPDDLPRLVGVRDHAVQVILNLILNAIDATPMRGEIALVASVSADRSKVLLSVRDNGRGITREEQARVFQPHFTTKPHGTGLGLYISRKMLEEMGGRLTFESEPGVSTTFTLELPAVEGTIPRRRVHAAELTV